MTGSFGSKFKLACPVRQNSETRAQYATNMQQAQPMPLSIARLGRLAGAALLLICAGPAAAQRFPVPPCASAPEPGFAQPGEQPAVKTWSREELKGWKPPPCVSKTAANHEIVVALSGTFQHRGGADELLARLGSLSRVTGVHYWSVTDDAWRVLITDASALSSRDPKTRRADFSAREVGAGRELYFVQSDSRSTGEVVYRMHALESRPERIVLEVQNATPVRLLFIPVFKAGDLVTYYFLDRRGPEVWSYYALTLANGPRAEASRASFVNRAVALYRRFIGIPEDSLPPLAP